MSLRVVPLTLRKANDLVARLHRHHAPVRGHRFALGALDSDRLCGAAIVGRPVARAVDWRRVAEVTRLVSDGTRNVCSLLYGACSRVAAAMGFESIQTYILASESGVSLRASGWHRVGETTARPVGWRNRDGRQEQAAAAKVRWARNLRGSWDA